MIVEYDNKKYDVYGAYPVSYGFNFVLHKEDELRIEVVRADQVKILDDRLSSKFKFFPESDFFSSGIFHEAFQEISGEEAAALVDLCPVTYKKFCSLI